MKSDGRNRASRKAEDPRAGSADERTGSMRRTPTGAPATMSCVKTPGESLIDSALEQIRLLSPQLVPPGMRSLEFVPDPVVHRTSSGYQIVHLYQHCGGIPVFNATRTVRFDPDNKPLDVVGDNVPIPFGFELEPGLEAGEAATLALCRASESCGVRPPPKTPATVVTTFPLPSRPTVLRKPSVPGLQTAHLAVFVDDGEPHLVWSVSISEPDGRGNHEVLVKARGEDAGTVLYSRCTDVQAKGQGQVFRFSPDGGAGRDRVDFPLPLDDYPPVRPADLAGDFPPPWIEKDRTKGNNVICRRAGSRTLKGVNEGGVVRFASGDRESIDQRVLNAFYFCNFLHDFFYLLGFDEAERNFQQKNFTGRGKAGDALRVEVFRDEIDGGATMQVPGDGGFPTMKLGLVRSRDELGAERLRSAALDADIVFHEFVHGVTKRIVGGTFLRDPLNHEQSTAMGEGLSDYFALTIQNYSLPVEKEKTTLGAWVTGKPGGYRQDPYDAAFPAGFGDLGKERTINGKPRQYQESHAAGEIWCAVLMAMNRSLAAVLGSPRQGHELGWQLVMDSLKELPNGTGAPSFLDGRDAIFKIYDEKTSTTLDGQVAETVGDALREVFLRFGMGPGADCPDASYNGIVPDHGS